MNVRLFSLVVALCLVSAPLAAQSPTDWTVRQALAIRTVNSYVQSSLYIDPVEGALQTGRWRTPREGEQLVVLEDTAAWEPIEAGADGWFLHGSLRGGWVVARVRSDRDQVVLMESLGNKYAFVNGVPRVGNRYQGKDSFEDWEPDFGFFRIPVRLRAGDNEVVLKCNRGRLKVTFSVPDAPLLFNTDDVTVPDVRRGTDEEMWGAVVVINATESPVDGLVLESRIGEGPVRVSPAGYLPPLSVRKVPFRFRANGWGRVEEEVALQLRLIDGEGVTRQEAQIALAVRSASEQHRRTYRSSVDGSVQYYAVKPATEPGPQALVLSVHGANVEAWNQASSYAAKSWAHLVAPTNRRAYGYNWEDWGRIDALEVLAKASRELPVNPDRVYLTGHSMGGHGTWVLGSAYPDKFAAIAPSAGYLRVGAYYSAAFRGRFPRTPSLLERALNVSFTDSLLTNLAGLGVYVLHGGADDVVRPDQARRALDILSGFHKDFRYHEEPGMGHWWDLSDEPGTDAVDWPPLFDFFAARARSGADRTRFVDFRTAHPGVSATAHWATIWDQERRLESSRVRLRHDPGRNRIVGSTENVKVLALDPSALDRERPAVLRIDADSLTLAWGAYPLEDRIYLEQGASGWRPVPKPPVSHKGPERYGTFKSVIDRNVVFVYGTAGTREENAWALNKARFDAETFWYQGNGSIEVVPDAGFDPAADPDRNVLLYGNATTNRAWAALLGDSPVQVARNRVRFGGQAVTESDLAVVFVRPRPGSATAVVGAVGGPTVAGMRLTDTLPYLYQNFAAPDVLMYGSDVIGNAAPEVRLSGYFGSDWSVEAGEWEGR